ncbi:DUF6345 domain-containing protein [Kineosporia succinea]|uniref:Uncharacterized protein n=1 Tax=Kineosporia succinea TaxID=84632 RepID=A0ABT9NYK4_9ACTN|nr:DUF6345 domain-containing protein [Kineosporia succinea]MDP9825332.1 hypothetical protein [Kineosporia succinea]
MSRTTVGVLAVSLAAAGIVPVVTGAGAHAATANASTSTSATLSAFLPTAPVYTVVREGLSTDQAKRLARSAGIENALRADGSFSFTDADRFARVPTVKPGSDDENRSKDEEGNETVAEAVDIRALENTRTLSRTAALRRAKALLPVPDGYGILPVVDHTTVGQSDAEGRPGRTYNLDTTVTYQLTLGGVPVVGPGAKARASFAGDGSVVQLGQSVREVKPDGTVPIVSPAVAQRSCTALYGDRIRQDTPVLGYYAPPLTADRKTPVSQLLPHYICRPVDGVNEESTYSGKLVAASPFTAPKVELQASGDGRTITAGADATGGRAPYAYNWSSSSTALDWGRPKISYAGEHRTDPLALERQFTETLTVTVTDADGLTTTAHVDLVNAEGEATAKGISGGAGGALATNGIEQTVDEWQCAQDSANGFRSVMQNKNQSVKFDFRGTGAWEKDFKDKAQNGLDQSYVDSVDAQWYTGHGWSGGFTFKGNHDDGTITPADARWGDDNLEWLQLESCQVLKDINGKLDYFGRWAQSFQGLHLLNGFDTTAYCLDGGTGRRFASYLFTEDYLFWTRKALTVQQAWGTMANDLEPAGVRWRSVSPATLKNGHWVTNLGDFYWGQGTTGPDISPASTSNPLQGFFSVSGVS